MGLGLARPGEVWRGQARRVGAARGVAWPGKARHLGIGLRRMITTQHAADFDHLLRVAKRGAERGDLGPAEILLAMYRREARALERHPGVNGRIIARKEARLAVVRGACRDIAALLGLRPCDTLPVGAGPNPWAEAQKARRKRDPLAYMKLTPRQEDAADEIRDIFEWTVRALVPGNMALDAIRVDTSVRKRDPWLELPDWVAERRVSVYVPWAMENSRVVVARGRERIHEFLSATSLVLSVLVGGHSLRYMGQVWRADRKRLGRAFHRALDGYCSIAQHRRAT